MVHIQGKPVDSHLLGERLFLEAELPFFMLEAKIYPTTTRGDSIMIAQELYNKYRSTLNDITLPLSTPKQQQPRFKHYTN
ncbi:unnamed protein product [Rotaria magnacalcarata]|uniref:Uncharacterized protein n=1 Tax=Rotaria magnacalcarata TaxID=392030 RepID=A0A8S3IYE0_9BILA|nr:unnamed protein product [Rotaria magnacalcarata]